MKPLANYTVAALAILLLSFTACANNGQANTSSDSTITKIDTTVDPADHTQVSKGDSTSASSAPELDTTISKKQALPGKKESAKHK